MNPVIHLIIDSVIKNVDGKIYKNYKKTRKFLLFSFRAVLPMFVNNDIRKEMYKGADANVDAQFKKLYIYHMENVSILFADIKVSSWQKR